MIHECNFRVYFEDTDAGGIMYHSNYLNFTERGRTEMLRALGIESGVVQREQGLLFVVRHIDADYLDSARLDHMLTVQTSLLKMKGTSFVLKQSILRPVDDKNEDDDAPIVNKLLFTMSVTLVCITESGKPSKIPASIRESLTTYLEPENDG